MRYVLDTNTVSALMKGTPAVAARLERSRRDDVSISQVTVAEIEFGLRALPASRRRTILRERWTAIGQELLRLPWDDAVSRAFGERKARLERRGTPISDFDLAIAAHAIALDLIVVTSDAVFARAGVAHENWMG